MIYKIPERSFIILSNKGAFDFLQSMCTCNINCLKTHGIAWGAILTPQGKFLYGFFAFLYKEVIYLEVHTDILMECGAYLSKYAVNTQTDFGIVQNISAYAIWGEPAPQNDTTFIDPRSPIMGHRAYIFDDYMNENANYTEYHTHRIQNNIPDLETDVPKHKAFALELNMDTYNGVDFEKGCYIGQEVTARMHWRQALKKRLIPIKGQNLTVGEKLKTSDNKPCGDITFVCEYMAMAMVKINTTPIMTENNTPISLF